MSPAALLSSGREATQDGSAVYRELSGLRPVRAGGIIKEKTRRGGQMKTRIVATFLLPLFVFSGCATYTQQYVAFRPPEAYANRMKVDGVTVAAEAYPDKEVAEKAFGFDVRGAGTLPVQVVLDNKSGENLEIVSSQTFLEDDNGGYWTVMPNNVAVDRIDKFTQGGEVATGAGKGAVVGAVAVGLLGAAIGIVSGENVGSALGKGAAIGAAGGAIIGGATAGTSPERGYRIADDVRAKGLEGKTIPVDYLANGFFFFPGEAPSAKALHLQFRERESGTVLSVVLPLRP